MRKLIFCLCFAAGPALATGLEIDVAGEAEGTITIDLFEQVAPDHVARIVTLAENGAYDNIVFHRVIDGFMAQTGDVEFGCRIFCSAISTRHHRYGAIPKSQFG